LLLQDLQSPEQRAAADSEHGGQFTYRFTLLVQAQESLLLAPSSFIGLVPARPRLAGGGTAFLAQLQVAAYANARG